MYSYHELINAVRAHMIHINLNIFYTHEVTRYTDGQDRDKSEQRVISQDNERVELTRSIEWARDGNIFDIKSYDKIIMIQYAVTRFSGGQEMGTSEQTLNYFTRKAQG